MTQTYSGFVSAEALRQGAAYDGITLMRSVAVGTLFCTCCIGRSATLVPGEHRWDCSGDQRVRVVHDLEVRVWCSGIADAADQSEYASASSTNVR